MNFKIALAVVVCGLAASSLKTMIAAAEPANAITDSKPPNVPPAPGQTTPGHYQVQVSGGGDAVPLAIRVDTFTGRTWKLHHTPWNVKEADGTSTMKYFDHWEECLEVESMAWIRRHEAAPDAAPH